MMKDRPVVVIGEVAYVQYIESEEDSWTEAYCVQGDVYVNLIFIGKVTAEEIETNEVQGLYPASAEIELLDESTVLIKKRDFINVCEIDDEDEKGIHFVFGDVVYEGEAGESGLYVFATVKGINVAYHIEDNDIPAEEYADHAQDFGCEAYAWEEYEDEDETIVIIYLYDDEEKEHLYTFVVDGGELHLA